MTALRNLALALATTLAFGATAAIAQEQTEKKAPTAKAAAAKPAPAKSDKAAPAEKTEKAAAAKSPVAKVKGKCVQAGGEATMVTEDLAKFMANAALNNSMKAKNQSGTGPVTMKCDSNGLPHCIATQKACG